MRLLYFGGIGTYTLLRSVYSVSLTKSENKWTFECQLVEDTEICDRSGDFINMELKSDDRFFYNFAFFLTGPTQ